MVARMMPGSGLLMPGASGQPVDYGFPRAIYFNLIKIFNI